MLLCPWKSPGKNTGVGSYFILQGIFPTQRLNPCLLCLLQWQAKLIIKELLWLSHLIQFPRGFQMPQQKLCRWQFRVELEEVLLCGWYWRWWWLFIDISLPTTPRCRQWPGLNNNYAAYFIKNSKNNNRSYSLSTYYVSIWSKYYILFVKCNSYYHTLWASQVSRW